MIKEEDIDEGYLFNFHGSLDAFEKETSMISNQ